MDWILFLQKMNYLLKFIMQKMNYLLKLYNKRIIYERTRETIYKKFKENKKRLIILLTNIFFCNN